MPQSTDMLHIKFYGDFVILCFCGNKNSDALTKYTLTGALILILYD